MGKTFSWASDGEGWTVYDESIHDDDYLATGTWISTWYKCSKCGYEWKGTTSECCECDGQK